MVGKKLKDIGEFGFIDKITPQFQNLVKEGMFGIGDDCAIIPQGDMNSIVTTDMLVEDIHFLREGITPYQLGYKSLAVNLSDIAAMGGYPTATFLSIAIPSSLPLSFMDEFMQGYGDLSQKYSVPLLGGDTTKSPDKFVINVVAMGSVKGTQFKLRSNARAGQYICVTGCLGDSACGLQLLLKGGEASLVNIGIAKMVAAHNMPEPRLLEGQFLATQESVGAMMDISDGISSDLKHILNQSNVGAFIDLDALPISDTMKIVSDEFGWNRYHLATGGGEDYELLFTIDKESYKSVLNDYKRLFNKDLYIIGEITLEKGELKYIKDSREVEYNIDGFSHF